MTIPKVIYQTWKTKNLHPKCKMIQNNIKNLNKNYQYILYDDNQMEVFIKSNFDKYTYDCYMKLNVGAAKADFWRYCILYINGGIYLDMDSNILKPLDNLIVGDEQCIITREGNKGTFNNWIMIFQKNHPILLETIKKCCYNITNKTTNDVCLLTGPTGPFTDSINKVMKPFYKKNTHLYFENDHELNEILNSKDNNIRVRFYGVDMEDYAEWKHKYCSYLYKNCIYWRDEKKIFK